MKKYEIVHFELHVGGEDYDIGLEGFYIEAMIKVGTIQQSDQRSVVIMGYCFLNFYGVNEFEAI